MNEGISNTAEELRLSQLDVVAGGKDGARYSEADGLVVEVLPGDRFSVRLQDGRVASCYLSGKLRLHNIRVLPGDSVTIEFDPSYPTHGRIIWRSR